MKILAVILARGGSKRLPNKNILPLGGKPLIKWSIRTAQEFPELCDVLVSTDDKVIAELAKKAGALVPWLRPVELASDTATSVDAVLHALDWYESEREKLDGLLLLQPTSPFRSHETVQQGIELFSKGGGRSVVGVTPASLHPMWALKIIDGALKPWLNEDGLHLRSQDLPPAYVVTGSFYLATPQDLRLHRTFLTPNVRPLVIEEVRETIDIDTAEDFAFAEAVLESLGKPAAF